MELLNKKLGITVVINFEELSTQNQYIATLLSVHTVDVKRGFRAQSYGITLSSKFKFTVKHTISGKTSLFFELLFLELKLIHDCITSNCIFDSMRPRTTWASCFCSSCSLYDFELLAAEHDSIYQSTEFIGL